MKIEIAAQKITAAQFFHMKGQNNEYTRKMRRDVMSAVKAAA